MSLSGLADDQTALPQALWKECYSREILVVRLYPILHSGLLTGRSTLYLVALVRYKIDFIHSQTR
jgi:hypothetical protein